MTHLKASTQSQIRWALSELVRLTEKKCLSAADDWMTRGRELTELERDRLANDCVDSILNTLRTEEGIEHDR